MSLLFWPSARLVVVEAPIGTFTPPGGAGGRRVRWRRWGEKPWEIALQEAAKPIAVGPPEPAGPLPTRPRIGKPAPYRTPDEAIWAPVPVEYIRPQIEVKPWTPPPYDEDEDEALMLLSL